MNIQKIKAFTLVELIVVITILAILGTIAFISLSWYSADARDSTRLSDMSSMKSSLELFNLESWRYPIPSNETAIIYSGATAWTQWTFGDTVYANVSKLDKVPKDPSTDKEYVYSTTWPRNEFQLAWAFEGETLSYLNPSQASLKLGKEQLQVEAATKTAKLKLSWSYNGKVLKVSSWATTYILAMPSIMTTTWSTVDTIVNNNYLAYDGYKNLPYQYSGSYNTNPETNLNLVNSGSLLVFSWDISVLSDSTSTWVTARQQLIQKLQLAYTGTSLVNVWEISQVLNTNTSDSVATEYVSTYLVKNDLGGSVKVSNASSSNNTVITYSCALPPAVANATFTDWTPTVDNQWRQNTNSLNPCYYSCDSGYSWNSGTSTCDVIPLTITWDDTAGRTWSDGSFATTCNTYINPGSWKSYAWATWDWIYWIKPDSNTEFKVYCDMTNDWGGLTLAASIWYDASNTLLWSAAAWWTPTPSNRPSKLSDTQINAIKSLSSNTNAYRMTCGYLANVITRYFRTSCTFSAATNASWNCVWWSSSFSDTSYSWWATAWARWLSADFAWSSANKVNYFYNASTYHVCLWPNDWTIANNSWTLYIK